MQSVFCGRDSELRLLKAAFDKAGGQDRTAPKPQLIVLLGESGLGKTRIVQEFYGLLSRTVGKPKKQKYWPHDLGQVDDNLRINPDPARCNNEFPIPYLWWGMRLSDPGKRNDLVAGAIYPHLAYLAPHLEPMYNAQKRADRITQGSKTILGALVDFVLGLIPGAGPVAAVKTGATAAFETLKLIRDDLKDHIHQSTGELAAKAEKAIVERVLADFDLLHKSKLSLPIVLFIDDAQFSKTDHALCDFLEKLMARAWKNRWPILILITCWEYVWHEDRALNGPSMARIVVDAMPLLGADWKPTVLQPADNLEPMLRTALEGITVTQRSEILSRAGGNPGHLGEMINLCKLRRGYFEKREPSKALTDDGLKKLLAESTSVSRLIEARLMDPATPASVRQAVTLSSLQGMQFVCRLTREIALDLAMDAAEQGLLLAEEPHGFVQGVAKGVADFKQRVVHDVAREALQNVTDEARAENAIRARLRDRIEDRQQLLVLALEEREVLTLVCANLLERSLNPIERALARKALGELAQLYLSRYRFEDAASVYERLLATAPSSKGGTEWQGRVQTLDFLAALYSRLNWPSKQSSALKRVILQAYGPIGDIGRILAFTRDQDDVKRYFENWKQERISAWAKETPDVENRKMESVATEIYVQSVVVIVGGLLELSELARHWPNLSFAEGDGPIDDAPFMITTYDNDQDGNADLGKRVGIDSAEVAAFWQKRAYNLGSLVGESYSQRRHFELLVDDVARKNSNEANITGALDALERALRIAEELDDHLLQIQALSNLGSVYGQFGDRAKSERALFRAGQINNANYTGNAFPVVALLIGENIEYRKANSVGASDESQIVDRFSIPVRLEPLFDRNPEEAVRQFRMLKRMVGNIEGNLGDNALKAGEFDNANDRFKYALESFTDLNDGPNIALTFGNLAAVAKSRGDIALACSYWRQGLSVYEKLKVIDSGKAIEGRWSEAIAELHQAIEETGSRKEPEQKTIRVNA